MNGSISLPYCTPDGQARLAGAAVEAEVQVIADLGAHRQPAVGHGAHQVDPAARAIVLVASLDVGRAARRAEAAVDAVLVEAVVDLSRQPVQVDPRVTDRLERSAGWRGIRASQSPCDGPDLSIEDSREYRRDTQIVPTNRPGFITPLGSSAGLTRSAKAQSGRGVPQTRSAAFQSVGQRERIRLPPSRSARARSRSSSGPSPSRSTAPRACPRTMPLPACAWMAQRRGRRP